MKRFGVFSACAILLLVSGALTLSGQQRLHEPPMRGIHWARGQQSANAHGSNPDMSWHGGPIMVTAQTAAIFWRTNWSNPNFVRDKITGLNSCYKGVGGSAYGASVDEYTGTGSTQVSDTISYIGHQVDTSPAPSHAPKRSAILNEVSKVIPTPSELTLTLPTVKSTGLQS